MSRIPAALAVAFILYPVVSLAEDGAMAELRATGALVLPIAQGDERLDVGFHLSDQDLTAEHLRALHPLADRIIALNLRGKAVDNAMANELKPLRKLERLHLEKTPIGDSGLTALAGMKELRYLNLYGTEVSDAVFEVAAQLPKLEKLYVWQTNVTPQGVREFSASRPQVEVIGVDLLSDLFSRSAVAADRP